MVRGDDHAGAVMRSEFADDPEMAEILGEFVADLPSRARDIEACMEGAQVDSLKRLAHQLAGASAGYGFSDLGKAARELELALEALSANDVREQISGVRGMVNQLTGMCRRASAD